MDVVHTASREFTDLHLTNSISGTAESHKFRSQRSRDVANEQTWNYFKCIKNISEEIAAEASGKPLFSLLPESAHHPLLGVDANMICGMTEQRQYTMFLK
jgi:hypothetical protein